MEPADGDPTRNGTVSARAQGSLVHAPRIEQDPIAMHAVLVFAPVLLHSFLPLSRSRSEQALVALALRQQLASYAQARLRESSRSSASPSAGQRCRAISRSACRVRSVASAG